MRLRIAITRRADVSILDGVNRFIFNLTDGLSQLGHEIHVISQSSAKEQDYLRNLFGVEGEFQLHTLSDNSKERGWTRIALNWATKGSKLIDKLNVDAVIVNGIVPLRINQPRIVVNHGISMVKKNPSLKDRLYLRLGRYLYKKYAGAFVFVSEKLRKEFNESVKDVDSVVIPLPVRLHNFHNLALNERENYILHIGTSKVKNMGLSVKISETLEKMNVNAKLVIVGHRNPETTRLTAEYKHNIPRQLDFVYEANSSKISDLLAHAKALILPSEYEALPYVVLEAFASGLPVVVSSAIPEELVHDKINGFRVNGFNQQDYADTLANLLTSPEVWDNISKNAVKTASSFSHTEVARAYETAISKMINTPHP